MSQFRFAYPSVILLFPLLLLLGYLTKRWLGRRSTLLFPTLEAFRGAPRGWRVRAATVIPPFLRWMVIALALLALARPQTIQHRRWFEATGVDIVLSLDTSGSMKLIDMDPHKGEHVYNIHERDTLQGTLLYGTAKKGTMDRLDVVKAVARKFISQRHGDRVSLVVFGTYARTLTPLTHDLNAVNSLLELVEVGMVGETTDLQKAIEFALKRLVGLTVEDVIEMFKTRSVDYILEQIRTKQCSFIFDKETLKRIAAAKLPKEIVKAMRKKKPRSQIIILLTDGKHTAKAGAEGREDVLRAAREAALYNIKIYTIGIGSSDAYTFLRIKREGQANVVRVQNSSYDKDLLTEIARLTKGRFFSAQNKQALDAVYQEINKLEPNRYKVHQWEDVEELYLWFLLPLLVLLGLELLLRITLLRRLP